MQQNTSERYTYLNRPDAVVWGIDTCRYCEKQIRVVGFTKSFSCRDLVPSSRMLVSITDMCPWLALSVRPVAPDFKARRTSLGELFFTNACYACGNAHRDESLTEWGGMFAEGFKIEGSVRSQPIVGNRPLTVNAQLGESIPDLLADEGIRNRFTRDVRTLDLSELWWRQSRRW